MEIELEAESGTELETESETELDSLDRQPRRRQKQGISRRAAVFFGAAP